VSLTTLVPRFSGPANRSGRRQPRHEEVLDVSRARAARDEVAVRGVEQEQSRDRDEAVGVGLAKRAVPDGVPGHAVGNIEEIMVTASSAASLAMLSNSALLAKQN